jgi:sporulation protein YlmC with PRC-barrel domain
MAHRILVRIGFASFLFSAVAAHGQSGGDSTIAPAISAQNWNASELIGQKVCTMRLDEVGKIRDLVMGPDGKIVYAAISFEGFTKNSDKLYAVPMEAIYFTWKDGKVKNARVDVTEDKIKQLNAFDKNHEPLFADAGFARDRSGVARH